MRQQNNRYAGFVNGYIAGNLDAHATELNLHSEKIFELMRDLESESRKGAFKDQKTLGQIKTILAESNIDNSPESYQKLGQSLSTLISLVNEEIGQDIPSQSSFLLKKIIYHFLNIAKASKLRGVEQEAIEIAAKYQSIWKG